MAPKQLVDRFIADISKLIEIRGRISGNFIPNDLKIVSFLVDDTPTGSNKDIEIALQIIDNGLLSHQLGEKLNIHRFLNDLTVNQEKIVEQVKCIRDGNMESIYGKPTGKFDLLIETLEKLHQKIMPK
ncbi:MAG: hypothetical protein JWQ84_449 [Mucilaginibacter sp.]|nr:hypothetical protein [Mucilaginibacter sp.]